MSAKRPRDGNPPVYASAREILSNADFGLLPVIGVVGIIGHVGAQLAMPWIVGLIIDDALTRGDAEVLLKRCGMLALAAAAAIGFKGVFQLAWVRWAERALYALKHRMLTHLARSSVQFLDSESSGRLNALFTIDAAKAGRLYNPVTKEVAYALLQLVLLLAVLAHQYGTIAFLAAALLPIYTCFPLLASRPIREASREVQTTEVLESSRLQELIGGLREVKAFNRESWTFQQISPVFQNAGRLRVRVVFLNWIYNLDYIVYWTALALIYWIGGSQVLEGSMTIGQLVALVSYLGYLQAPVGRLFAMHAQIQAAYGAVQHVLNFLGTPVENDNGNEVLRADDPPAVEFDRVTFRYPGREDPVLDSFKLLINPGERVAIIGPSGAGKSTLLKLLLRFYSPQSGSIRLDGKDLGDYRLASLRTNVGTVLQEPYLFSGSVRDNIRFGRLDATDPEIEEAARLANAHDFIAHLPLGYETQLGERGAGLSVGQRQRIAIARAAIRRPRIILLDEPTSALDAASEHKVYEALERLMSGCTSIIIAHQLSTISRADVIVVLDKGIIIARGTHSQLLETCSLYRGLHELQVNEAPSKQPVEVG